MSCMVKFFWDAIVIVGAVGWILGLAVGGYLSVPLVAMTLVATVFFVVAGRGLGGRVGRLVRLLFGIGIPVASFVTWMTILTGGDLQDMVRVFLILLPLGLLLIGLYVMFCGLGSAVGRKSDSNVRGTGRFGADALVILSAIAWIVGLGLGGYLSAPLAALALAAVVAFLALGRGSGGGVGRLVRLLLGIGMPVASLLTWVTIITGGDSRDMVQVFIPLLVLGLSLAGFYVMFYGLWRRK